MRKFRRQVSTATLAIVLFILLSAALGIGLADNAGLFSSRPAGIDIVGEDFFGDDTEDFFDDDNAIPLANLEDLLAIDTHPSAAPSGATPGLLLGSAALALAVLPLAALFDKKAAS